MTAMRMFRLLLADFLGLLVTGLGAPVELRRRNLPSGVICLSCHRFPGGRGVAARPAVPGAPCRPKDAGWLVLLVSEDRRLTLTSPVPHGPDEIVRVEVRSPHAARTPRLQW